MRTIARERPVRIKTTIWVVVLVVLGLVLVVLGVALELVEQWQATTATKIQKTTPRTAKTTTRTTSTSPYSLLATTPYDYKVFSSTFRNIKLTGLLGISGFSGEASGRFGGLF